jgi:hypothetical protein
VGAAASRSPHLWFSKEVRLQMTEIFVVAGAAALMMAFLFFVLPTFAPKPR